MSNAELYEDMLGYDDPNYSSPRVAKGSNIPLPSYEKASGKAKECCTCIHRGVCAFSKEYENFCKEIEEKCKLLEYQHFSANMYCGHYMKEQPLTR